jgi:class 3 adenylate cyclase
MGLLYDLRTEVGSILSKSWEERDGQVVPDPPSLKLGNDAVNLQATVLYADINGSTKLVDKHPPHFAAEVYKSYMICTARIIKDAGGVVTAYDGDRIMGIFIGKLKNTTAAKTALKINWAVRNIVNSGIQAQYGINAYQIDHVIGVDTSEIMAARIGVRNDNDIVWVGRAANYAAKLTALNTGHSIYMTGSVFDAMHESAKTGGAPPRPMWERAQWTAMNNMIVHRSNWTWAIH